MSKIICHCNKCKGKVEVIPRTNSKHLETFGLYRKEFIIGQFTDISVTTKPDEMFWKSSGAGVFTLCVNFNFKSIDI